MSALSIIFIALINFNENSGQTLKFIKAIFLCKYVKEIKIKGEKVSE